MFTPDAPKQNHILAALPAVVYRRLLPRLQPVTLPLGRKLIPARGKPRYVYFPTTSIVSLSYGVEQGVMAKAWPVGNEGIVGISAFLDGPAGGKQAERGGHHQANGRATPDGRRAAKWCDGMRHGLPSPSPHGDLWPPSNTPVRAGQGERR